MRHATGLLGLLGLLALLATAACGRLKKNYGPAPAADHQATIRTEMDRVLDGMYRLEGPSAYRFAEPVRDRVARWLFDPQIAGRAHEFGYRYGWRVDFWVTPRYVGYPPQPESQRMAFFADGGLRGLFSDGGNDAPLELNRWSTTWVDRGWAPSPAAAGR
jgi:hypothetical protein